ncbi:hypothetical protein [Actinokineospora pegani]|uniref:hypothetical protein n=1 Tax=Actinokineospora pegani TaxID=2654637 RepID=UPI0012E9ED74|nr:hypothetical protein [Actinokineospora pegani]
MITNIGQLRDAVLIGVAMLPLRHLGRALADVQEVRSQLHRLDATTDEEVQQALAALNEATLELRAVISVLRRVAKTFENYTASLVGVIPTTPDTPGSAPIELPKTPPLPAPRGPSTLDRRERDLIAEVQRDGGLISPDRVEAIGRAPRR